MSSPSSREEIPANLITSVALRCTGPIAADIQKDQNADQGHSTKHDFIETHIQRLLSFARRRRISRYSQIRVTIRLNAPNHSMYLGAPCSAPASMKSKSSTRFSAAMATTNRLKPIPKSPLLCMKPIDEPKKPIIKLMRYKIWENY